MTGQQPARYSDVEANVRAGYAQITGAGYNRSGWMVHHAAISELAMAAMGPRRSPDDGETLAVLQALRDIHDEYAALMLADLLWDDA